MSASPNTHSVEFDFLGQRISMISQGDPEFISEIVDLVTLKVEDALKRSPGAPAHKVALLGLFDLAEDYLRAKRKFSDHRQSFVEKTDKLIRLIEEDTPAS